MSRTIRICITAWALGLAGCDGGGPLPPPTFDGPDLTGAWSYSATISHHIDPDQLELGQEECSIEGVTVNIVQSPRGKRPASFSGTASAGRMDCALESGAESIDLPSVALTGGIGVLDMWFDLAYSLPVFGGRPVHHWDLFSGDEDYGPAYAGLVEMCDAEPCWWGEWRLERP